MLSYKHEKHFPKSNPPSWPRSGAHEQFPDEELIVDISYADISKSRPVPSIKKRLLHRSRRRLKSPWELCKLDDVRIWHLQCCRKHTASSPASEAISCVCTYCSRFEGCMICSLVVPCRAWRAGGARSVPDAPGIFLPLHDLSG